MCCVYSFYPPFVSLSLEIRFLQQKNPTIDHCGDFLFWWLNKERIFFRQASVFVGDDSIHSIKRG